MKILKVIIGIFLIIGAFLILFFLYSDFHVRRQLALGAYEEVAAIYSEPLFVLEGQRIKPEIFSAQLLRRRYQQRDNALNPGEFSVEGDSLFKIVTRPFTAPDGTHNASQVFAYDSLRGQLVSSSQARHMTIEPQVIAPLSSDEVKASRFTALNHMPDHVLKAVLAIEDERFYSHLGIDPQGIARAMYENVKARRIIQGGSTITQQLAKNLFFSPDRTIIRKLREAAAAVSLESRLNKDRILELYLNEVYLGQEGAVAVHGMPEAASVFFGKELKNLNISEAALLAGIIRAPSFYSPRRHLERALSRRNVVLSKMHELGFLDSDTLRDALSYEIKIAPPRFQSRFAAHFSSALRGLLSKKHLNLEAAHRAGLRVYTAIDIDMQACAETALKKGLERLENAHPRLRDKGDLEAGIVAIEPYSGKIKAWQGGRNFGLRQFDHVSQARRQIGSTVKPFVFLTALDGTLNQYRTALPTTILSDRPISIELVTRQKWQPENYDRKFRGDVTLRYALENSLNVPAVELARKAGLQEVAQTVRRFAVAQNVPEVPALALGALDASLLELTAAYSALANNGIYVSPRMFTAAVDNEGVVIASSRIEERRVAAENSVFLITDLLKGALERGTGRSVRREGYLREAAGKTGTSSDSRDSWFVGYTANVATGVWVGFSQSRALNLTGATGALPIWTEFMKCIEPYHEEVPFVAPPGVVFVELDPATGLLAHPSCGAQSIREVFIKGTEPDMSCSDLASKQNHFAQRAPDDNVIEPDGQARRRQRSLWELLFN
jgi:penicillin-binding protein 1B